MTLGSSASITGLAVLENVNRLDRKVVVFDAQFFVNEAQTIVAALRFFNRDDYKIEDLATYMVVANVSVLFILPHSWLYDRHVTFRLQDRWMAQSSTLLT